jgi:hypothetical protein
MHEHELLLLLIWISILAALAAISGWRLWRMCRNGKHSELWPIMGYVPQPGPEPVAHPPRHP